MLSAGDHAPPFNLLDATGERFILRQEVGFPQLLVFQGSDAQTGNAELLQALQAALPDFERIGAKMVSIGPDSLEQRKQFAEDAAITYCLLSDPHHEVAGMFCLCEADYWSSAETVSYPSTAFLLDANLMIVGILSPFNAEQIAAVIETFKICCPKRDPYLVSDVYAPPVLLIPDVLDGGTCRALMDLWETQNQVSHFMRADGDKTVGVVDARMKIRRDHFIKDEQIKSHINGFFQRRVYPEIEKCFNYVVYEYEHFKIACYDAETGGYFRQHRDNTSGGTAHRKWALSLNLNTDEYEGGYLRFPEYGPQLYKPPTGSAVVFSCSLMHEATDVTAGRRFVLLSFFYGENESRNRELYLSKYGTDDYIPKEVTDSQ